MAFGGLFQPKLFCDSLTLQLCPRQATWGCLAWTSQDCHSRIKSFWPPDTAMGTATPAALSCAFFSFKAAQKGFRSAPELSFRPSPWLCLLLQGKERVEEKKKIARDADRQLTAI